MYPISGPLTCNSQSLTNSADWGVLFLLFKVLLDSTGYAKLCDMGFARFVLSLALGVLSLFALPFCRESILMVAWIRFG